MTEAFTLLEISFEDLDASRTLLKNYQFPQSLFYFQQAVEKATKSIGLFAGVLKIEDLQTKIGHETLRVYREVLKNTTPINIPWYNNPDNFDIDKTYQSIMNFAKNLDRESSFPVYINQIEEYKKAGGLPLNEFPILRTKKDYLELIKLLNIEIKNLSELEQLPEDHSFFKTELQKLNEKIQHTPKYIEKVLILYVLGLIVVELVTDVRYPETDRFEKPSSIYNSNHFLIQNLDYLQNELYYCIKEITKSFL